MRHAAHAHAHVVGPPLAGGMSALGQRRAVLQCARSNQGMLVIHALAMLAVRGGCCAVGSVPCGKNTTPTPYRNRPTHVHSVHPTWGRVRRVAQLRGPASSFSLSTGLWYARSAHLATVEEAPDLLRATVSTRIYACSDAQDGRAAWGIAVFHTYAGCGHLVPCWCPAGHAGPSTMGGSVVCPPLSPLPGARKAVSLPTHAHAPPPNPGGHASRVRG